MKPFATSEKPDETGQLWMKWKKELMTRFRFFRIDGIEDRVDAINIYGGELIRELIDTLQNSPACDGEDHNEFEKIITKLESYFIRITTSDSARSKFAEMSQANGESIAQYHFRLRSQAAKCKFPEINDAIRSKLLQTMIDFVAKQWSKVILFKNCLSMQQTKKISTDKQRQSNSRCKQVKFEAKMSTAYMKKNRVTANNVGAEVKENEMKRTVNNELTCVPIVEQVTKTKDPHARR